MLQWDKGYDPAASCASPDLVMRGAGQQQRMMHVKGQPQAHSILPLHHQPQHDGLSHTAHLTACEDGNVLQVVLAAVAEAWGLDGAGLDTSAELVDDEGGEGLALHILSDDQQRPLALHHRLQHWKQGA